MLVRETSNSYGDKHPFFSGALISEATMRPPVWKVHLQKDRQTTRVSWFLLALLGFWHAAHYKVTFLLFFHL